MSENTGTRQLGRVHLAGLETSQQGLGCMGMSELYGPTDWDGALGTIHRAMELGVTLLDTADVYGTGHNEVLVGRAVATGPLRRDAVQIATKFGVDRTSGDEVVRTRGDAAYVRSSCDASLRRLGVDVIDVYYVHRPPTNAEVEETVGAMAELVRAGKVRHLGVSEFDAELLRRAHAVHPITALETEYSLWSRDVETLAPVLSELGVGLVAYSPLGRGFLTGAVDTAALTQDDYRSHLPRFSGDAAAANQAIARAVRQVADSVGATPAQVALAWVAAQRERLGVPVVPIPGTRNPARLAENTAAAGLRLDDAVLARLDSLAGLVVGDRY
ncbi:aldo/keto reductase [Streptomyces sp. NPDC047002]|uniref:aldo/keto reductase n=1 Tax=Streptomyces sp. NPDC047002 TaxID=3155475 RepID=UPI003451EC40